MDYKKVKMCRVCGSKNLRKYLDLGRQPLANQIQDSPNYPSKKYPLQVLFCERCALSQLSVVVDPKILYKDYPYHSSVSRTFREHCIYLAEHIKNITKAKHPLTAIDIACNDGVLLEAFIRAGYGATLGVEPSKNLAQKCERNKLTVINDFWHERALAEYPPVDIITALNVFAHVDDLGAFLGLVYKKLNPNGVFILEVPYLANLIKQNQFDTIYHEHLSYFLFSTIKEALHYAGLEAFRVEEHSIHGGSIRVFACKDGRDADSSVSKFENAEFHGGYLEFKTYKSYAKKVNSIRDHFKSLMEELKQGGKKVMGYGASAKGATLLNYCGATHTDISAIVDDTPAKQGKFQPGTGIPIIGSEHLDITRPDYILLTAWNFSAELKEKTRHVGARYIIAIPQVRIE